MAIENTSTVSVVNISEISKDIAKAHKDLGWSRQIAAAYIGISEQSLCRWENGSTKAIKATNYDRLMDIMNGTIKV